MYTRTFISISRFDYWFLLFSVNAALFPMLIFLFSTPFVLLNNYKQPLLVLLLTGISCIAWQHVKWNVSLKRLYLTYSGAAVMSFSVLGFSLSLIGVFSLWFTLPFVMLFAIGVVLGAYGLSVS